MPQRKLQRLDNFSLSKDFERENLICRRFSVCQLNTLSAESSFRVIKHVLIYLINIRQNIAKRTLAHYVLNNSRTSIISTNFVKLHKKVSYFLGGGGAIQFKILWQKYKSQAIKCSSCDFKTCFPAHCTIYINSA